MTKKDLYLQFQKIHGDGLTTIIQRIEFPDTEVFCDDCDAIITGDIVLPSELEQYIEWLENIALENFDTIFHGTRKK